MNKITRVIDFQKMYKLKTPASRYSELSVSISEKGDMLSFFINDIETIINSK